jgi:hypothetical protein
MRLLVGKREVRLPERMIGAQDVRREVDRVNVPFVVHTPSGRFKATQRVFLEAEDARVECEGEAEVDFACRLASERHNLYQAPYVDWDTERIEAEVEAHMAAPDSEDESQVTEEQDISIQEWEQLGYKWFRKEDVLYI